MFSSIPRLRIIVSVILAQVIGFVWYSFLFSKGYQQEMKMKPVSDTEAKAMMPKLMLLETLSRFVYFIGLAIVLTYSPGISLEGAAFAYFCAVIATERSGIIWSDHSWRLMAIRGGKVAVETVVAVIMYGIF